MYVVISINLTILYFMTKIGFLYCFVNWLILDSLDAAHSYSKVSFVSHGTENRCIIFIYSSLYFSCQCFSLLCRNYGQIFLLNIYEKSITGTQIDRI